MSNFAFSRLCILLFAAVNVCFGQLEYVKSDVLEALASSASGESSESSSRVIAAFCVPWYDPCKELSTELETAQTALKQWTSIVLIDCDKEPGFCASHEIQSHPAIRILEGNKQRRYRGRFKAPAIITEVMSSVLPLVSAADENTLKAVKISDRPLLLLTHEPEEIDGLDVFSSVAESVQGNFFAMTTTDPQLSGVRAKLPHIAVFNSLDGTTPVYQGPLQLEDILQFTEQVSSPLIGTLDLTVLTESMKSGVPLGMIFAEDETELKSLAESLKNVALKHRGHINFATADARKLGFMASALGLDPQRYPAFALQTREGSYVFDQSKSISGDAIDRFIGNSLNNVPVMTHMEL